MARSDLLMDSDIELWNMLLFLVIHLAIFEQPCHKYIWDMPEFRVFYRIETVSTYQYSPANLDSGSIQSQDWKALQASMKLVCLEFLGRQLQIQMRKNRIKSQSFSAQMMLYTSEHWDLSGKPKPYLIRGQKLTR